MTKARVQARRLRLFAALATLALAANTAVAADLPFKAPPIAALPLTNWSGFYAGINAGGGMAQADFLDPDCFSCADTKFHTGFGTAGGQVGYNWQWGSTVLGIEGDLNWVSAKDSHAFALADGSLAGTASFKFDAFGSLRARAGLAFDRTLVYVTAGPAWGHFNSVTTLGDRATLPSIRDTATDNAWHAGLAVGAGVEFTLAPHWSLRGEYLFLDFPDVLVNLVPIPPGGSAGDSRFRMNHGYSAQLARIGLNYRFDEGAPILAAGSAIAADTGRNVYKAPPPVYSPATWAGFYMGMNGGSGITSAAFLDPDCFTCANTKFKVGFATVGGQTGYNWQWGSTVFGIEGDLNWVSASASGFTLDPSSFGLGPGTNTFKFDAFGSLRARAGLAFDRTLVYVTAGPAWGHFNAVRMVTNSQTDLRLRDTVTDDDWHAGLAAGFGIEFMLAPHWTLRGEYLYLDFANVVRNLMPVPGVGSASDANSRMNFAYSAHLARVGLNYKLDGGVYQAPARVSPVANWAGFYIGANAGGGMAQADFLDPNCFSCTDTTFHKGFGTFGGQAGYNWQWASTVLGIEGDLNWVSAKDSQAFGIRPGECCTGTMDYRFDGFGSLRARAGLAFDRTLAYVTAGPAWGHFSSVVNSPGISVGNDAYTVPDDGWRAGIAIGAGVEVMLAPQWTLRGEYLNLSFHDNVVACVPLNARAVADMARNGCHVTFANSAQLARVGLNYKFDWSGPVVTKY